MRTLKYMAMLAVTFCLTACGYTNHFLDEEEEEATTDTYNTLSNVTVSAYTWTYINLITGETETHPDTSEWIYTGSGDIREAQQAEAIGIDWHVAVHRYEFKTNRASVLNTGLTDILSVTRLPDGTYTPDETAAYETEAEKENGYLLIMDMAGMMNGVIGYARNPVINRVLCGAITRTATGGMPPTVYGTTNEVFVLKWTDGSWATLQITGTLHTETSVSHYMSFNYNYYSTE
ncbi:MAG: HmuY family protein [Mediterranea sp.]|nr:HmuY family protein [Mediterranea sp.]